MRYYSSSLDLSAVLCNSNSGPEERMAAPPPLPLSSVSSTAHTSVPISPRTTTPPGSPRRASGTVSSASYSTHAASTYSMVERANPTICVELLLQLEVRIRVSDHTPERVRDNFLAALKTSFFKPSDEKFQYKGEIQMWQIKLHPYLLAGHLPSISTFIINALGREGYIMSGQAAIDTNRTDWVFWFQPLPLPRHASPTPAHH